MDTVTALGDDSADLIDPHLPAVVVLSGATRREARSHHSINDRLEKPLIIDRKWAVDEDVPLAH